MWYLRIDLSPISAANASAKHEYTNARINAHQISGDEDRDAKCNRNHPRLAAAEQKESESNDAADQHVDDAAAKKLAGLLRLGVGGGNQGGNRPDRVVS
jgi:hypothetical protein